MAEKWLGSLSPAEGGVKRRIGLWQCRLEGDKETKEGDGLRLEWEWEMHA